MIGAVVLAAGEARRFGSPKQLAPLAGRPMLEHAVTTVCGVEAIERVVVVLGARADEIETRVRFGRAEVVRCGRWRQGMGASLRTGARALGEQLSTLVVAVGDQPHLRAEAIRAVLHTPGDAVRASYGGRPGHPAVMRGATLRALLQTPEDVEGRALMRGAILIPIADVDSGADVDTPDQLADLARPPRPSGFRHGR